MNKSRNLLPPCANTTGVLEVGYFGFADKISILPPGVSTKSRSSPSGGGGRGASLGFRQWRLENVR